MRQGHAGAANDTLRLRWARGLRAHQVRAFTQADALATTDVERTLHSALVLVDQARWARAALHLSPLRSHDLRAELASAAGEIAHTERSVEKAAALLTEAAERRELSPAERPAQDLASHWRRALLERGLSSQARERLHAWCADPDRWLRRHAWLALADLHARGLPAFGEDPVAGLARLEGASPAPCDSLAFLLALTRRAQAWPDHLLDRLELSVLANQREARSARAGLGRLAGEVGRLGTLRRLRDLQPQVDLAAARERAERVVADALAVSPKPWVILDREGTTLVLTQPASHLSWHLPEGDWAIRLRGSEVDLDLFVRRDGPPDPSHPATLAAATLAADEVLPLPPGSGGLHQLLVRRARPWPHGVAVRLELVPIQSRFTSPWGLSPRGYDRDDPTLLPLRRAAFEPKRVDDALRGLSGFEQRAPEAILERARILETAGRWRALRGLPARAAGLRPAVSRALRFSAARAASQLGDFADAEQLLRALLAEEPTLVEASEELALALVALKRPQEAREALQAVAADPTQRIAAWLLRMIEAAEGGAQPAIDEDARKEFGRRPRLRLVLGRALIDLGRPRWWLELLDERSMSPPEQILRAEAHLALGRVSSAKRALELFEFSELPPFRKARLRTLLRELSGRESSGPTTGPR
ncbi:MAG TPA: hypothetical protein DEA08_21410 [Planctomycetes bacterium]|nr:hypothetical protein [Planctomycetota bacterium]